MLANMTQFFPIVIYRFHGTRINDGVSTDTYVNIARTCISVAIDLECRVGKGFEKELHWRGLNRLSGLVVLESHSRWLRMPQAG